jgi:hypothetical protein
MLLVISEASVPEHKKAFVKVRMVECAANCG